MDIGMDKDITYAGQILKGLTSMIMIEARSVANEQYHPGCDADKMDDTIKSGKEKIIKLRKMREEFENLESGILW